MKMLAYIVAALVALTGVAQAQTRDTYVMHGMVERTDHPNNRIYVRGDDGRDYIVDIAQGQVSKDAKTAGQEVTIYGKRTGDLRIEASSVVADRDYQTLNRADRDRFRPDGWEQLQGQVVSVGGSGQHQLRLRTDDGKTVMVDMSRLPDRREEMIRNLSPGAAVTVIGDGDSRTDRFVAHHIRFDDRDLNRRAWGRGEDSTATASNNRTIRGTVVGIEGSQQHQLRLRTEDGKTVMVDMSSLPDRREDLVRRLRAGASVTVIGDDSRSDRFVAREVRFNDRDVTQQPSATSGEVQVHGTIDTIHKDDMRLRTDDGRIIRVNIDPLRDLNRERIKVGQRVTVTGVFTDKDANKNEMTARTIRVDGAQSSAPATPSGEQQVRGTIDTIQNDNLRLRTDDGRIIRVNIDPVRDNVRERIKAGQRVTVVGVYTDRDANKNEMTARTVRVDDNTSASPATNRPRNADDCKERWSSYGSPGFKNLGDCVSYVTSPRTADHCKDRWSSYRNPGFKNLGDCVSYVTSPRTADDCKDRWSSFSKPGFKNLGDCVSYVTSPRTADDCKDRWSSYRTPGFRNLGDCVSHVNARK